MSRIVCVFCERELPRGSIGACPACGRLAPQRGEAAPRSGDSRRWLAAPIGLGLLGAAVLVVLALVLAGFVASGWI